MQRLLLPLLATLPLLTAVEANLFQQEPTYNQIVSQCKRSGLKYAEYNEIGMTPLPPVSDALSFLKLTQIRNNTIVNF